MARPLPLRNITLTDGLVMHDNHDIGVWGEGLHERRVVAVGQLQRVKLRCHLATRELELLDNVANLLKPAASKSRAQLPQA